jgi:octaheme c-type cytochrome (tetrathionate reductase family)
MSCQEMAFWFKSMVANHTQGFFVPNTSNKENIGIMKYVRYSLMIGAMIITFLPMPTRAAVDHQNLIPGPVSTGPEVTEKCLECHKNAATDIMRTSHWTWSSPQEIEGKKVDRGKKNALNNFCISINANWPRCTSCHIGYGWMDASFNFNDPTKVDCLVCHDTTGTYKKDPTGAGMPDASIDLLYIARNVGKPTRMNCGACHFFGGGGDAVKHGDLDSSMDFPELEIDVHMAVDGLDFNCQNCHRTQDHFISGNAMVVSPTSQTHIGCANCHEGLVHQEPLIESHLARVACQTCHIPSFAKEFSTKTSWDWSTAGKEQKNIPDAVGKPTFAKKKGNFTWGKNIIPTYAWYRGEAGTYLPGETIDPAQVTRLSYPLGSIKDSEAKIFPFKIHTGKQIYDKRFNYLITPKVFGQDGFWSTFDWDQAAQLGMAETKLPYSGEFGFAETSMYWRINHMVAPKEQALGCLDCHGKNGRMNWMELGYNHDPLSH